MFKKVKNAGRIKALFALVVIPLSVFVAYLIFENILGDPANFMGNNNANEPAKGNYLGVIYKGGPVVILLISFQVILLVYVIERAIMIMLARGRSSNKAFLAKVQEQLEAGDRSAAIALCDEQRGSLANVVKTGLEAYTQMEQQEGLAEEVRIDLLEKELQEASLLEMPMLTENMVVISTLASISTLMGLFGTVTGMISAFSALARVGAPDAIGLANGISQALVTTALGIATAAVAIVAYNYFATRIGKITTAIEEISYSIVYSFKTSVLFSEKANN